MSRVGGAKRAPVGPARLRAAPVAAAAVAALALHACGDADVPTEPAVTARPSAVTLHLEGSRPGDGALLVRIRGAGIDSTSASGDLEAFHAEVEPGIHRVLVVGPIRDGPLATVWIPDGALFSRYEAVVEQAAASVTYMQRTPTTYRVSLVRE